MSKNSGPEPLLNSLQAAAYLAVDRKDLYKLVRDGLPHLRLSERRLRFRKADLDEWAEQRTRKVAR